MGLSFVLRPVQVDGEKAFLRAEGTTDFANLVSGQCFQASTTDSTYPRRDANGTVNARLGEG